MTSYLASRVIHPLVLNLDTRWKWVVSFTLRPLYPAKERLYELNRRPCGFQRRSGLLGRQTSLLSLSGFEASTTQPLPNQYMDYALFCLCPTSVLFVLYCLQLSGNLILSLWYREEVSWEYRRFCCTRDTKTRYLERASRTLWLRWKYLALWLSSVSGCRWEVRKQTHAQAANLRLNAGRRFSWYSYVTTLVQYQ
jgi:hypothetical protein